ncbi:MAG TPA: hypothetical protein VER33_16635, partial [Polyangiaceae bacterium]|nr:hypothetical protein [Polyangiaceae bacterium]
MVASSAGDVRQRRSMLRKSVAALAIALSCVVLTASCVGSRPKQCSSLGDCDGGFCNSRGYCQRECSSGRDCPCGSSCAADCGICVRDDGAGPATCFAFRNGLSQDDVLGVCRAALTSRDGWPPVDETDSIQDAAAGNGPSECSQAPLAVADCPELVPA